mmetsp:Transcript_18703/g.46101  ORF Transcript_18703/g.46101 Transcript_18703/m.46101 type:complete len:140 (+) Transcript_18703:1-420(+)
MEFNYANRRRTADYMVPVVMEKEMRDTHQWTGSVGMVLGGHLFTDFSIKPDNPQDEVVDQLVEIIRRTVDKFDANNGKPGSGGTGHAPPRTGGHGAPGPKPSQAVNKLSSFFFNLFGSDTTTEVAVEEAPAAAGVAAKV